ncbi:Regulatory protein PchR [termite gut metagenome]|uniref:Regulatory protein PchR n=1 Tax=termite gut metagenome TaxID=433724 RepID=A0A5J4T294_9ZZZZ
MKKDKQHTEPNVLKSFAHLLGTEVKNRRLEIPEKFGTGYCAGFVFNEHIRMLIFNYKVKEKMLEHTEIPPVIKELAVCANMSPSKLKRLFKQIFGNSIFSYYQEFRMKEAARLLKEEKLSVSDVGYKLSFTNLSHFSRVFNEHIGMKPKQYSRS